MPLLSFWAAVDVARSTSSLKKWKSFSDSMHCFLNKAKMNPSASPAVRTSNTFCAQSFRKQLVLTHMWATDMTVLGFDWVIRQVLVNRHFRNISNARADLYSSGVHSMRYMRKQTETPSVKLFNYLSSCKQHWFHREGDLKMLNGLMR